MHTSTFRLAELGWVGSGCVETAAPGRGVYVAHQTHGQERQSLERLLSPARLITGPASMGLAGGKGYDQAGRGDVSLQPRPASLPCEATA